MSEKRNLLKVTPERVRTTLLRDFPKIQVAKSSPFLLKVPVSIWEDVLEKHALIRNLMVMEEQFKLTTRVLSQVELSLAEYRGNFDSEINAYTVKQRIPNKLFEKAKRLGLVFSVRYKSEFIEEESPDGVLIWFIREDV